MSQQPPWAYFRPDLGGVEDVGDVQVSEGVHKEPNPPARPEPRFPALQPLTQGELTGTHKHCLCQLPSQH